jgi:glucosamine--fructose-6-phosphate aminotransferase (isomerizing)
MAIVHNGIIENYALLKASLMEQGYEFTSETDTEVFVHLINFYRAESKDLLEAVQKAIKDVKGAYGAAVIDSNEPSVMIVARCGSPLVIGCGIGENFVASDQIALLPVTNKFIYLKDGDVARLTRNSVDIYDVNGCKVTRETVQSDTRYDASDKNGYNHYMEKEIYEQPSAIRNTLEGRIINGSLVPEAFGVEAPKLLKQVRHVQIVACGTSYHAGLIAKYWIEQYLNVSCSVEIASEYRYRKSYTYPNSLFVTISQSGETADTLEALRLSKKQGYMASLAICNVSTSSLVRESDLCFLTKAGTEIGVASTKAFITQLVALLLLTANIGVCQGTISSDQEKFIIDSLQKLPLYIDNILNKAAGLLPIAEYLKHVRGCIFLGRGINWPVAMEGALKLKEISYIHAEAYAGGELKHGPIALIDQEMPTIVVAPSNNLLDKLRSNIESVKARKGFVYIVTDENIVNKPDAGNVDRNSYFVVPKVAEIVEPIVYTVPLQLIAYKVAVLKGTDVDQPRNLAKSVTVE